MKIVLATHGQNDGLDVTRYLDAKKDVTLTQERERDAFQRVVSDLDLSLSNLTGQFYAIFLDAPAGTMWDVKAMSDTSDGGAQASRVLLNGVLGTQVGAYKADTIKLDMVNQKAALIAYSQEKLFWRTIQSLPIYRHLLDTDPQVGGTGCTTVQHILERELIDSGRCTGIIKSVDAGQFATRPIAWFSSWNVTNMPGTAPLLSQSTNYFDLAPETTVADLLNAMSVYYNAQFYIEPDSSILTMAPRASVLNDLETDISSRISSGPIDLSLSDMRSIDYASFPSPALPVPQLDRQYCNTTIKMGNDIGISIQVAFTYIAHYGGVLVESDLSDSFDVPITQYLAGIVDATVYITPKPAQPAGDPVIDGVRVYVGSKTAGRWGLVYEGAYLAEVQGLYGDEFILLEFTGLSKITYKDNGGTWHECPDPESMTQQYIRPRSSLWVSYSEGNGWTITRPDAGDVQPNGVVTNLLPTLSFQNASGQQINNLRQQIAFFGNEISAYKMLPSFLDPYKDLFLSKRKLSLKVEGLNYMLGDSVIINRVFDPAAKGLIGKYWIKKAVQHMMNQETELEIVQV